MPIRFACCIIIFTSWAKGLTRSASAGDTFSDFDKKASMSASKMPDSVKFGGHGEDGWNYRYQPTPPIHQPYFLAGHSLTRVHVSARMLV